MYIRWLMLTELLLTSQGSKNMPTEYELFPRDATGDPTTDRAIYLVDRVLDAGRPDPEPKKRLLFSRKREEHDLDVQIWNNYFNYALTEVDEGRSDVAHEKARNFAIGQVIVQANTYENKSHDD